MKLKDNSGLEVVSSDQLQKEMDVELTAEETSHIIKALSDSIYQNKPGSMVREMTSNAWDANLESGSSDPAFLTIRNNQLIIKDSGPGFSEDRMAKVFNRIGGSTKRHTNKLIGGFGIGSKTPLAYTTDFTLKTWVDGVRYIYVIHKTKKLPKVILTEQVADDLPNGTEVVIAIKPGDVSRIEKAIKEQLIYFDNLWVTGVSGWDNTYQLIQQKTFVYNSVFAPTHTNICLGQVAYPLPFHLIEEAFSEYYMTNMRGDSRLNGFQNMGIGLKFENGELPVTLSREAIEFDSDGETEQVIKQRIIDCIKEFEKLYRTQQPTTLTLQEYMFHEPKKEYKLGEVQFDLSWHTNLPDIPIANMQHLKKHNLRGFISNALEYQGLASVNKTSSAQGSTTIDGHWVNSVPLTATDFLRKGTTDMSDVCFMPESEKFFTRKARYITSQSKHSVVKFYKISVNDMKKAIIDIKARGGDFPEYDMKHWDEIKKYFDSLGVLYWGDYDVPKGWGVQVRKKLATAQIHFNSPDDTTWQTYSTKTTLSTIQQVQRNHVGPSKYKKGVLLPYKSRGTDHTALFDKIGKHYYLIRETDYASMLANYPQLFISMSDYLKSQDFRTKITLFKVAQLIKLKTKEYNYNLFQSDFMDHLSKEELEIFDVMHKHWEVSRYRSYDDALVEPFLEYIDKENPNFYRQEFISLGRKLEAFHNSEAISKTACLQDKQLRAQVYAKILKDPLTNEFIKKYLLPTSGK